MEVYHNQKRVTITVEDSDGDEPGWTIVVPRGMVTFKIWDEAEDDEEEELEDALRRPLDSLTYKEPRFKMKLDVSMEIGEENHAYRVQYNEKESYERQS